MVLWLKYLWSSDTITAICIVVLLLECMLCVNIFYASYTSWWEISISTTTNDDYHAQYRTFNDELWQFFKYIYMHVIDWFEICRGQIRNSWWQKYILRKIKWIEQLYSCFQEFPMFFLNVEITTTKCIAIRLTIRYRQWRFLSSKQWKCLRKNYAHLLQNRFLPRPCNNSLSWSWLHPVLFPSNRSIFSSYHDSVDYHAYGRLPVTCN